MQRILLIDNYDSFTYNLEHYLVTLGASVVVRRNDEDLSDVMLYDKIVFSPGPGLPNESKLMFEIMESVNGKIPILGVCLGMQAMALFLNGELYNLEHVQHGVSEIVVNHESVLFEGMEKEIEVGLYHSWAVKENVGQFLITGVSKNGVVMSLENRQMNLFGIQYHPESIMTKDGLKILANFLQVGDSNGHL